MKGVSNHIVICVCALVVAFLIPVVAHGAEPSKGEQLARQHCGSCHLVPQTEVLPRHVWPYLLDLMGLYFGYDDGKLLSSLPHADLRDQLFDVDRYPDQPSLARDDWLAMRNYYESSGGSGRVAPPPDAEPLTLFEPVIFEFGDSAPVASLVHINRDGGLYLGDGRKKTLHGIDDKRSLASGPVPGIPVQINTIQTGDRVGVSRLTLIGSLPPSNIATGAIAERIPGKEEWRIVIDELHRPVNTIYADLDLDGDDDILVCEFGHYAGRLGLYEQHDNGNIERHILSAEPGAVAARLIQNGENQLPDVLVLGAQAREGIVLYQNRGHLQFNPKILLEKHPGYGYTDMHLADFDGDGTDDVLTVNGDNGDLPGQPLRSYHGLRIYRMSPGPVLEERVFLPVAGAFRAATADFDSDGDIDIAAISFFPDSRSPEQGFVYFENTGDMNFSRKIIEQGSAAPWMTMSAGDVDRDGDMDILLGSGYVRPQGPLGSGSTLNHRPSAMLLRNKSNDETISGQ